MKTESQEKQILNDLLVGVSITPLDALNRYGCFRLGARILNLRKQGFNIITENVKENGKRYAKYSLK